MEVSPEINENFASLMVLKIISITILALVLLSTFYDFLTSLKKLKEQSQLPLSFSLLKNFKTLINLKQDTNSIGSIHGIRCIAIFCIILQHIPYYRAVSPFIDQKIVKEFGKTLLGEFFTKLTPAVDSFFVIAGVLMTRATLKSIESNTFNNFKIILQRFFTITPCLAFMILLDDVFTRLAIKSEDDLATLNDSALNCWSYWWSTLLHIQNYFNPTKLCYSPSWFLSVDFQMFLVSPALIYLLWKFKGKFLVVIYGLIFGSCLIGFGTSIYFKLEVDDYRFGNQGLDQPASYYIYLPTHIRGMPFLVGILLGYYIYTKENSENPKEENSTILQKIFTFLSLYTLSTPLTTLGIDIGHNLLLNAIYIAFGRLYWAASTAWLIYSCQIGFNKLINSFLSFKLWIPFGRMGLSIYLIHPIIYRLISNQKREKISFDFDILSIFVELLIILVSSILFYLTIQEPVNQLTKHAIKKIS